jgi:pimeloyl-ACP methyl ester carboxylesterase
MFDTDLSTPEALIASLDRQADRFETPSGDGVMVWRAWGEGEPLLLTHGSHGSWVHWIRNIPHLAKHRRVLAADMPGFGDSAPPPNIDSAWPFAEILAAGLRQLPFQTPMDVMGFSIGGGVAAHLAAHAPDLVRRLICVGMGGLGTPLGLQGMKRLTGLHGEARLAARRHNMLRLMLHAESSVDELALHIQVMRAKYGRVDPALLVAPDKVLQVLAQVRAPIDLIYGAFDQPHPNFELQASLVRRTDPQASLHLIDGAGHWAMYEKPDDFHRIVDDLLAQPARPQR